MLPINPPCAPPGNCPYSSTSAFAGSPWLINLDLLVEDGLLERADVQPAASFNGAAAVNYTTSQRYRLARLRRAFAAFESRGGARDDSFVRFRGAQRHWLDEFALYSALKEAHRGAAWTQWGRELRLCKPAALRAARQGLASSVRFHQFVQFIFDRQWTALKGYCNERDIGLIGDIPIFVAHDSADVWVHRHLFLLDEFGRPTTVSGYPPDDFNALGQKWGHPHYEWKAHKADGFGWWIARFRHALRQFDAARIDHFLGFDRCWHIPGRARTAKRGSWKETPGEKLFAALRSALGPAAIIAEDLGKMTDSAAALRDKFKFPGMRVMQFGFGEGGEYHLPDTFVRRCVAYTGTHDNETIVGWYDNLRHSARRGGRRSSPYRELRRVNDYAGGRRDGIHWALIRVALMSVADTVIFPVQDVLGLGEEARMNVPGTIDGNWRWRLRAGQLSGELAARLAHLTRVHERT